VNVYEAFGDGREHGFRNQAAIGANNRDIGSEPIKGFDERGLFQALGCKNSEAIFLRKTLDRALF